MNVQKEISGKAEQSEPPETVLVVDDSRAQRRLLSAYLTRMGHRVLEAPSGEAGLAICQFENPDLIVSDWMMPGMDGLEFCQAFRRMRADRYGYFILLTSNAETHQIARGLDAGADDFLTKPVHAVELRARIRAGQRVLRMERTLTATLDRMTQLHNLIDRDLQEAQKLQQSLVRDRFRSWPGLELSLMLSPAGRIGGDLVGVFEPNSREIGVFALDVSGHGITSALMTARLAAYFAGNLPGSNLAIAMGADGIPFMRPPSEVAAHLNDLLLHDVRTDQYLTLVMARIDLASGSVTLTQAGHPHPVLRRADGRTENLGNGGMPVGLLPDARFSDLTTILRPGDRLLLGSDGITECMSPEGEMFEEAGLHRLLTENSGLSGPEFLGCLTQELRRFSGVEEFADDVSAVLIDSVQI